MHKCTICSNQNILQYLIHIYMRDPFHANQNGSCHYYKINRTSNTVWTNLLNVMGNKFVTVDRSLETGAAKLLPEKLQWKRKSCGVAIIKMQITHLQHHYDYWLITMLWYVNINTLIDYKNSVTVFLIITLINFLFKWLLNIYNSLKCKHNYFTYLLLKWLLNNHNFLIKVGCISLSGRTN